MGPLVVQRWLVGAWPPCGTLVGAIVVMVGGFQCRGAGVGWMEVWGVKLRRGVRRRALGELNKEWVKYWGVGKQEEGTGG